MSACATCGLEVAAGARFCANCGDPVVRPAEPREEISAELPPGTRLDDRYEILRALGRGGMGVVYLARDHDRDGSLLALKLLPPELTSDAHGLALLKQEASVAMRLSHPNIVRLHNLEGRTRKYVTMEYVDGGSLADLVIARTRGQLPRPPSWSGAGLSPAEVVPLLDGIAAGLDHAHSERVIHRDMKPANVLYKRRGDTIVPKVADFGIAREIREQVSRVTQNVVAGTPSYMSPEHYRGEKIDARADVYSVAATVYTLLAARPPFKGGELSWQILNKEPDPIHGVSPAVFAVIKRGMAKDARGRPDSCGAFAAEFRAALASDDDSETINPNVPVTTSPHADVPTTASPHADTPTTRGASIDPANEVTAKPPPTDAPIPVPSVVRDTPALKDLPPLDTPTVKPPPARSGGARWLAALVLVAGAAFGWRALPPRAAVSAQAISDLIHEGKLGEAAELLHARKGLSVEDGKNGLGIGFAYCRRNEPEPARKIWHFVMSRSNEMRLLLRDEVDRRYALDPVKERLALQVAVDVINAVDPGTAWAVHATARLNGVPEPEAALMRARDAVERGDYPTAIALLKPMAKNPEAAVLLYFALSHLPGNEAAAQELLGTLAVGDIGDVKQLILLNRGAIAMRDWKASLVISERWAYLDDRNPGAWLAASSAAERLADASHRAAEYRARALRLTAQGARLVTPPAPPLGPR